MKMRALVFVLLSAAASLWCVAQTGGSYSGPIIDMHLHALHADDLGPPPDFICFVETRLEALNTRSWKELSGVYMPGAQ